MFVVKKCKHAPTSTRLDVAGRAYLTVKGKRRVRYSSRVQHEETYQNAKIRVQTGKLQTVALWENTMRQQATMLPLTQHPSYIDNNGEEQCSPEQAATIS